MYEDMMIQELDEDQLEQVVGGKKHGGAGGGAGYSGVSNDVTLVNANTSSNTNTNTATSSSTSTATGGNAAATTGAISITLVTI